VFGKKKQTTEATGQKDVCVPAMWQEGGKKKKNCNLEKPPITSGKRFGRGGEGKVYGCVGKGKWGFLLLKGERSLEKGLLFQKNFFKLEKTVS